MIGIATYGQDVTQGLAAAVVVVGIVVVVVVMGRIRGLLPLLSFGSIEQ